MIMMMMIGRESNGLQRGLMDEGYRGHRIIWDGGSNFFKKIKNKNKNWTIKAVDSQNKKFDDMKSNSNTSQKRNNYIHSSRDNHLHIHEGII